MADSLITGEVDLSADGKSSGYLRIPHSTHQSAYGWIPSPITTIANGEGPTVLLLAGVHGDEYEGQIALSKLCRDLSATEIRGRLIILPAANCPAASAGQRVSPIDGGNLNRSFPGNRVGTPTEMLAHYLEHEVMPLCDYLIDLHSGGSSLYYPPTLLRGPGHTPEETKVLARLQEAFDLPYAWVFSGGGGPKSTARTAMGAANRNGVVPLMAELGGSGALSAEILKLAERGIRRVLHAIGSLPDYEPGKPRGTRTMRAEGSVYAYDTGVFESFMDIADPVDAGETVGLIHDVYSVERDPIPVTSPFSGFVLAKRPLAQVARGDALYQIARDIETP